MQWDRLLSGVIILAIVAVVASSSQGAGSISALGSAIARLAKNVVGSGSSGS